MQYRQLWHLSVASSRPDGGYLCGVRVDVRREYRLQDLTLQAVLPKQKG